MNKKKLTSLWRTRRFISLLTLFSFLASLCTGLVCYIKPTGRVANWTAWMFLGMTKVTWEEIHVTTSVLLLLGALTHVWFNWKPLKLYLKGAVNRMRGGKLEFLAAAGLLALTWFGTARGWQPFVQLAHWNGEIKAWWEEGSEQAPRPHAEDSTLATVAGDYGLTVIDFMAKLQAAGFKPRGESEVLGTLATRYRLSAAQLIRKALGAGADPKPRLGQGGIGSNAQGWGIGRTTLKALCQKEGIDVAVAIKKLAAKGVPATKTTRVRLLAGKLGVHPRDVAGTLR